MPYVPNNSTLNQDAKPFVPQNDVLNEDCVDVDDMSPKGLITKIKHENPNKIMIGHLNINSIRLKFEFLKDIIGNNIDIFLISETKLNDTFPLGQFMINGYHVPFRLDRNDMAGVCFYISANTFHARK